MKRRWLWLGLCGALWTAGTPDLAQAAGRRVRPTTRQLEEEGLEGPRERGLPAVHRFRLGLELEYIRLTAAQDVETGEKQRFHYVPLGVDFAYQARFLKYAMVRPSLALAGNVGNTMEAMPLVIHPQLHTGYQGRIFGAAIGYGWFSPPLQHKDAISVSRGGLEQPLIRNNHHVGGEVSVTTRIDRGALSIQFRFAGVSSRTQHLDLDKRRWRPMIMFSIGWYFGDGQRQAARRSERRLRRASGG